MMNDLKSRAIHIIKTYNSDISKWRVGIFDQHEYVYYYSGDKRMEIIIEEDDLNNEVIEIIKKYNPLHYENND